MRVHRTRKPCTTHYSALIPWMDGSESDLSGFQIFELSVSTSRSEVSGASVLLVNGFLKRFSTGPAFSLFCPTHTHLWPSVCPFHPLQGRWRPPLRALAVVTDSTDGACKSIQQRLRGREKEKERKRERLTNRSMSEDYKLYKYESLLIPAPWIYSYQLLLLACVVVKSFQADEQFSTEFSVP